MATMGKSSPTAPAASTYRPNWPESMSLSCRMGSSVPSAVVVSASPIGTKSRTKPIAPRIVDGAYGDEGAERPAADGQAAGPFAEQPRVKLVPGQQEQESQPDIGQQLDAARISQAEDVRADHDAGQDQDDDLGNARPRQCRHDEWCERGHHRYRQQCLEAVHLRSPPPPGAAIYHFPG